MKDGYWHCDLHSDMWEYVCFECGGVVYAFVQLPFGCAPACWVFTKLIKVMVASWRGFGLKILAYIDDGLAGAASKAEAKMFSDLVIEVIEVIVVVVATAIPLRVIGTGEPAELALGVL